MSISIEKLTEAVLLLPSDARALLADRLVESLDPITDDDIRNLWVVEAASQKIAEAPMRWPILEQDVRRCLTRVFPYAIL